jgi:hypothetical protein
MTSREYILLSAQTAITGGGDPVSYWEAMKSTQKEEWVRAMKEEMDALMKNDTWELVDCPKSVKVIYNCWVLQTKLNADGLTQRLCACLVAKRHVQKAGIDYDETFSPVTRCATVCAVLTVVTPERLQFHQFDVKMTFLYSTVQEDVHMHQT